MTEQKNFDKENLQNYQNKITRLESIKQQYSEKFKKFQEENKDYFEELELLCNDIEQYKEFFKIEATRIYKSTQKKQLLGGLGIRVGTKIEYDNTLAFQWAKEHSLCLSLDKSAFEKIAKTQEIEFVKKQEQITVTFPKEIKFEV